MSKKEKLQLAIDTLMQGNRVDSARQLWLLESEMFDKKMRIQLIDALITASNFLDGGDRLLELCDEGIKIALEFGNKQLSCHFMLRKVDLLMAKLIFPEHEKANLKLSPDWIEFSTELDKFKYEELEKEINSIELEIDSLLAQAEVISHHQKDEYLIANILLIRGNRISNRLIRFKSQCMLGKVGAKIWLKLNFLRFPQFEFLVVSDFKNRRKIKMMTQEFIKDILQAAKIFEKLEDVSAGYAYHALANNLKSLYRFKEAIVYLRKAKIEAQKHDDLLLLKQIESLNLAIKDKNKNIPNYIEGEKR